jgi:hypothetical protein
MSVIIELRIYIYCSPAFTVHAIHSACLLTSLLNSLAVGDGTTVLLRRQLDNNKSVILRTSAVQLCHPVPFVRSSNSRCCASLSPSSERGMGRTGDDDSTVRTFVTGIASIRHSCDTPGCLPSTSCLPPCCCRCSLTVAAAASIRVFRNCACILIARSRHAHRRATAGTSCCSHATMSRYQHPHPACLSLPSHPLYHCR